RWPGDRRRLGAWRIRARHSCPHRDRVGRWRVERMSVAHLVADRVSFGYTPDGPLIVEDWSAEFPVNSVSAISGPSGCGKSTRIYLLALMLRLRAGAVRLAGRRVDALPDAQRSRIRAEQ